MLYRTLQELGISAENVDSLAQSYKKWLINPRPLIHPYGLVYYVDGTLCSMPFQIKEPLIKPVGIEVGGVFYLCRCLNIEHNPDFPDWDDMFIFSDCLQTTKADIPDNLHLLKKQIFMEFVNWGEGEPNFELKLPTKKEMLTLSDVLHLNSYVKNLFSDGEICWFRVSKKHLKPFRIYGPDVNYKSHCYEVMSRTRDFVAKLFPVVHQGPNTFIGRLDKFEVPDAATAEMYNKLIKSVNKQ